MFSQEITIVADGVTKKYGLTSILDNDSQRVNAAAPLGAPEILSINHEVKGKNGTAVARHMVRMDVTKQVTNPDGSTTAATASVYTVLVVPSQVIGEGDVLDAYWRVHEFLAATESGQTEGQYNLRRVLRGEP